MLLVKGIKTKEESSEKNNCIWKHRDKMQIHYTENHMDLIILWKKLLFLPYPLFNINSSCQQIGAHINDVHAVT